MSSPLVPRRRVGRRLREMRRYAGLTLAEAAPKVDLSASEDSVTFIKALAQEVCGS